MSKAGVYHLVASGETSWFGYASYVFEQARSLGQALIVQKVNPIPTRLTQHQQPDHTIQD